MDTEQFETQIKMQNARQDARERFWEERNEILARSFQPREPNWQPLTPQAIAKIVNLSHPFSTDGLEAIRHGGDPRFYGDHEAASKWFGHFDTAGNLIPPHVAGGATGKQIAQTIEVNAGFIEAELVERLKRARWAPGQSIRYVDPETGELPEPSARPDIVGTARAGTFA